MQDLPDLLHGFNGGFSCKSFSKMHPNFQSLQHAMLNDDEDTAAILFQYVFVSFFCVLVFLLFVSLFFLFVLFLFLGFCFGGT